MEAFVCFSWLLGWDGAVCGRSTGLRDSVIKALRFPLLASKDGQQNREENLGVSFSDETFFPLLSMLLIFCIEWEENQTFL